MSTVAEIEHAIEKLNPNQLLEVAVWIGKHIEECEDASDLKAAEAALAEGGEPIEWEEVKKQLGLS
jgi:hypothetical protein